MAKTKVPVLLKKSFLSNKQGLGTAIALVIIIICLSFASKNFFTMSNFLNILLASSTIMVLGVGFTFILVSGEIDLSIGAIEALVSTVVAVLMIQMGVPFVIAIPLTICVGMFAGFLSGAMVAFLRFPSFIATLAIQSIAKGLGLIITNGRAISPFPDYFKFIGQGKLFGLIPFPVVIFTFLIIIGSIVMNRTRFGSNVYAIGSNPTAARLSGINVKANTIAVFMISGATAAIAGIIMTSRLNSGQATIGDADVMDTIAAVVIGGASMTGGIGKISGTVIGALIITVLRNGLNLLGVSAYWQQVSIGLIIAIAIMIDMTSKGEYKK